MHTYENADLDFLHFYTLKHLKLTGSRNFLKKTKKKPLLSVELYF